MKSSYVIAGIVTVAVALYVASGFVLPSENREANAAPESAIPESGTGANGQASGQSTDAPATGPAQAEAPIRVGILESVAQARPRFVTLRGQAEADRMVVVSAQTAGQVRTIEAEKGTRVTPETVIARLESDDRAAKLAEAKALLIQRREELQATAALSAKGYSPKLSLPDLKAKLALAEAAVAGMEIEIGHLTIKAPIDGVLEARPVEVGQYLKVGDPVATIVDLDPIILVGSVAEHDVADLTPGGNAKARLVDGREIEGRIRFIAAAADATTRTFRVEIEAPNADYAVRQGLSAELSIPVDTQSAHLISSAALTLDEGGRIGVKIVGPDDKVVFMPVRVAGEDAGGVWISGLDERARIIIRGQEFVKPGQIVAPVPVTP